MMGGNMNEQFSDARVEEVKLLSEIGSHSEFEITPTAGPLRDMIVFLAQEGLVTDLTPEARMVSQVGLSGLPGESQFERDLHLTRLKRSQ